jgi:outer membrane protein assembly factor BamB
MRRRELVRFGAATVGAALVLAALAVVGYRVFAPHEMLTRPAVAYPELAVIRDQRPFSELRAAPLVVDGRLRVYAEKWRVWSDAPVGGRYEATPYWAYRRWPAQVVGVATADTTIGPVVISQWSDGKIVALDARRGEVAWRASGPDPGGKYDGRRTGAATVYEPRSLLTARSGVRTVILATGDGSVRAFDAAAGNLLWNRSLPRGCRPALWTGTTAVALPDCTGPSLTFVDALSGRDLARWSPPAPGGPEPALCVLGRSQCRLVTVSGGAWLLGRSGVLTAVPVLEPGALLAGDWVVYPTRGGVGARPLTSNSPLWSWKGRARLVAADRTGVYLLTDDMMVLGLSPSTGRRTVIGCATSVPNEQWRPGHVYPTGGGYLALERLSPSAAPQDGDQHYFYGPRPVALVELYRPTKVPRWPSKFAACQRL